MEKVVVKELDPGELRESAGVAARALRDAPTNVACYGEDPLERMARAYGTFVDLFKTVSIPQLGAVCGSCPIGIAVVTEPGRCVGALFRAYAREVLARPVPAPGDPTREQLFWASWAEHDPHEEHWHIGPVGVEPGFQRMGVGGGIMRALGARFDDEGAVAWLETDKEDNVRFYAGLGFEVVDETEILEVPTWFMRRDPRSG